MVQGGPKNGGLVQITTPACNGFLKFTSDVIPADLIMARMAAFLIHVLTHGMLTIVKSFTGTRMFSNIQYHDPFQVYTAQGGCLPVGGGVCPGGVLA